MVQQEHSLYCALTRNGQLDRQTVIMPYFVKFNYSNSIKKCWICHPEDVKLANVIESMKIKTTPIFMFAENTNSTFAAQRNKWMPVPQLQAYLRSLSRQNHSSTVRLLIIDSQKFQQKFETGDDTELALPTRRQRSNSMIEPEKTQQIKKPELTTVLNLQRFVTNKSARQKRQQVCEEAKEWLKAVQQLAKIKDLE